MQDQGELESALADLNQLLELEENHRNAYMYRGRLLQTLGENERAIDDYTKRLTMRGGVDDYIFKRRALAYFDVGRFAEALADLKRAIDQRPDDLSTLTWIAPSKVASCPDQHFQTRMLQLAERAVKLNHGSAESRAAQKVLLLQISDFERSRKDMPKTKNVDAHAD